MSLLLAAKADVNATVAMSSDAYEHTALHAAVRTGDITLVKLLLSHGADVHAQSTNIMLEPRRVTALHIASAFEDTALVQLFLSYGVYVNSPNNHGQELEPRKAVDSENTVFYHPLLPHYTMTNEPDCVSALQLAITAGNTILVDFLLSHDADVNARSAPVNSTVLQLAVRTGNLNLVRLLVARGADVNGPAEPTSTGRSMTALRNAAHDGNMAFVRQLLDHDASDILTILQISSQYGNSKALDHFMGFAVWPTDSCDRARAGDVLVAAAQCGDYDFVQFLSCFKVDVDSPAFIETPEIGKPTALQAAAMKGSLDLARLLVTHGADVNRPAPGRFGKTSLQYAAAAANIELVNFLLAEGADANAAPVLHGGTALVEAISVNSLETTRLLLDAGADVTQQKSAALDHALHPITSRRLLQSVLERLVLTGAQLSQRGPESYSPASLRRVLLNCGLFHKPAALFEALTAADIELVDLLVRSGADIKDPFHGG